MPVVLLRVSVIGSAGNERFVSETSWYHWANVASLWMEVLDVRRLGVPSAASVSETADVVRTLGIGWSSPPMSSSWKSGLMPGAQFEAPWIRIPDASLAVPYSKSRTVPVNVTVLGTSAVTAMSDVAAIAAGGAGGGGSAGEEGRRKKKKKKKRKTKKKRTIVGPGPGSFCPQHQRIAR